MKTLRKQQGLTLAIALIILLILTIIGIAAVKSSLFQQKMSGNHRDHEQSFAAAEFGLKEAENWINDLVIEPVYTPTCAAPPCVLTHDSSRAPERFTNATWNSTGTTVGTYFANVSQQPMYTIEFDRFVPDSVTIGVGYGSSGVYYYRVTALGTGISENSKTVLQSIVGKRF